MKRGGLLLCFILMVLGASHAQVEVTNEGTLFISDGQLVRINGNLTNESSDFTNRGQIGLTGNLTNRANVGNPGNGILSFIGTTQQELRLDHDFGTFDTEVDNPFGLLFLDAPAHLRVYNHISFWDGLLFTNQRSMLWLEDNALYSNAYDFSHVNGPMRRTGIEDFIFPIGKNGRMRPAITSELSNVATFEAEYFDESFGDLTTDLTLSEVSDREYWYVDKLTGFTTAKLSFSYDESMNAFADLENVHIAFFADDFWTRVDSRTDGGAPVSYLISEDLVSEFGFFSFAKKSFQADLYEFIVTQEEDCSSKAMWVVAPGIEVVNYEVEFSLDSVNFVKLGEVAGDTVPTTDYKVYWFSDYELHEEQWLYYRLKLEYPDGSFSYSRTIALENRCPFVNCQIFPNPVSASANLNIRMETKEPMDLTLRIYDVPGRLLWEQEINVQEGRRDYEIFTKDLNLPAAPYFLNVTPEKSLKFIVITE